MSARSTVSIDDFTAEATTFLDTNAEARPPAREFKWGQGSDDVAVFDELDREAEAIEAELRVSTHPGDR